MKNAFPLTIVLLGLLTGCGSGPDTTSSQAPVDELVELEVVQYRPVGDVTEQDLENALAAGENWADLEARGLLEIEDWYTDWIDRAVFLPADPVEKGAGHYGYATIAPVSPGSTVSLKWSGVPQGYEYTFDVYARNWNTGSPIKSNKARADFFRFTTTWDWKGKDTTAASGWLTGRATCGSSCSAIRTKVTNRASSASHIYEVFVY